MFDRPSIRYNRSVIMIAISLRWRVIMWRKRGLSLNHIAETLFASETFVKNAAFRLNENHKQAVSEPPKRKSKKRKISGTCS